MADPPQEEKVALVLTGGGARAAYQVGVLCHLARSRPDFGFSILAGVSAGAINAAYFACHQGSIPEAAAGLRDTWMGLSPERVFRIDAWSLLKGLFCWGLRLVSGGAALGPQVQGLVDTTPLGRLLARTLDAEQGRLLGVERNLEAGHLDALALSTVNYATGRTVTWVEGRDVEEWRRPNRRSRNCHITVDHVMASAALPLLFPAVPLLSSWHGDGGIRLSAPLSPALHLGADRMLAISTRYRSSAEDEAPVIRGYPPPAQVAGVLLNAIFLDNLDQDARRLELVNRLLERLPVAEWQGLRPIRLMLLRPSVDLGRLAGELEPQLPRGLRFLTRGLGTRETRSPDLLSLLMFQPEYVGRLIEIGEQDAEEHEQQLGELLE